MNGLYYDGHAAFVLPANLRVQNFREPGTFRPCRVTPASNTAYNPRNLPAQGRITIR
ncbi:MAG TPA: hypothetical protein VG167_03720 [Verrucomicrobiae bacterium]|nr:hypothetical protein [Verrucomicrobiae bacterium]